MDLAGSYLEALQVFTRPDALLGIVAGVLIGLLAGVVPGLGGLVVLPILLPFVIDLDPAVGLPFLISILSVQFLGGSITAILLNVPGTGPNVPTMLDGYPMTQRGEAARAIGASRMASLLGSFLTTILAALVIPLLLTIVLAVRSAEMVMIILMGLSFLVVLSRASMAKGLISAALGLLVSAVGFHAVTGELRFTAGIPYLFEGITLIPVVMGLFAMTELISLGARGTTIARGGTQDLAWSQVVEGYKDVWRHRWLSLRSALIGFVAGLIPGMGSDVATFIAYGQAKQLSKTPERFGTGAVEGVIAPESANDAKEGGALLTTMAFGIPGSASWAILFGALLMMGMTPGPTLFQSQLPLILGLLYVISAASLLGMLLTTAATPLLARVATVPAPLIVGLIMPLVVLGTYSARRYTADLLVLGIFTLVGLLMRHFDYNRPVFLLGYILGFRFELELFKALHAYGTWFFLRPISLVVLALTVALFVYGMLPRRSGPVAGDPVTSETPGGGSTR
jgi:TctA family transporter